MTTQTIKQISFSKLTTILRREFGNYFNTPIGYVFLAIFSILTNFLFFYLPGFWDVNSASMENLFSNWIRIIYLFFIPAITMRLWADEKKTGTVEILFTLPFTTWEAILGKFLSAFLFLAVAVSLTFFIPISLEIISEPDWMLILGGYFGCLLLGAAYIAVGLLISWHTHDQIIAFLLTMTTNFVFFIMGYHLFLQFVGPLAPTFAFLSVSWHFDSLSRGILDSRDIIYFISFTALVLYLNYRSIESSK